MFLRAVACRESFFNETAELRESHVVGRLGMEIMEIVDGEIWTPSVLKDCQAIEAFLCF